MLKNTPPAAAAAVAGCGKTSSTCLKGCIKSVANSSVKITNSGPTCLKGVIAASPATKSATCTKSANSIIQNGGGTAAVTCSKSNAVNGAKTNNIHSANVTTKPTAATVVVPTATNSVPRCPNTNKPIPAILRNSLASTQTTSTTNLTTSNAIATTNGTAPISPNGNSTTAASPAAPTTKVENTELRIIIIDENWSQYCYRIKINTPFGKLINRFCQQVRKIDHKSVLFWYHGRLVEDDDTPKTLNIKDGEVILAHYIK